MPQAPFFPAFLSAARFVRPFVRDDASALTWVSVAASIAALPLLYGVVREIFPGDRRLAVATVVLYAFLPPVWFYAGIPISDTAGVAAALLVLWLALRAARDPRHLPAALAAFGLGCGIRPQSLLVCLVPLAIAFRKSRGRTRILAVAAGAVSFGAFWVAPVVRAAGGVDALGAAFRERVRYTVSSTAAFAGIHWPDFLHRWFRDPWVTTPAAVVVTALALTGAILLARSGESRRVALLAGIAVPYGLVAVVFLDPTFSGRYVLPVLPVVAILVAAATGALERRLGMRRAPLVTGTLALCGIALLAPAIAILHEQEAPAEIAAARLAALAGKAPFALLYRGEMFAPTALLFPGVPMWAAEDTTPDRIRRATALPVWRFGVASITDPQDVACWPTLPAFRRLAPGRYLVVPFGPWSSTTPAFRAGWSGDEEMPASGCRTRTFRWIERESHAEFPPLSGDADLELEILASSPPPAESVEIAMNDRAVARVLLRRPHVAVQIPVPAAFFRAAEANDLHLSQKGAGAVAGAQRLRVLRLRLLPR